MQECLDADIRRSLIEDDAISRLMEAGIPLDDIKAQHATGKSYDEILRSGTDDAFLSCFGTLDKFEEKQAKWSVEKIFPEAQTNGIFGEGSTGKTGIAVNYLAAVSSGRRCILDPDGYERAPARVAFFNSEDSVSVKLKRKLIDAGGNEENIITAHFSPANADMMKNFKIGSSELATFIRHFKPAVCVFDPLQGFIPENVNMAARNQMRACFAPLIPLAEETGTTFLIIGHTNKRKGAYGRDRISDSSDIYDIMRSVLMTGYTQEPGIRYLTQEKNSYAALQPTILFSIDDKGLVHKEGTSLKHDKDFVHENDSATAPSTKQNAKDFIEDKLKDGTCRISSFYDAAEAAGFKRMTIRRAVEDLEKAGKVKRWHKGYGSDNLWMISWKFPDAEQLPIKTSK